MIPPESALKLLFSRTKNIFSWDALLTYFLVYSLLAAIIPGLSIAAGLFIPMMLIGTFRIVLSDGSGASGGRMFGQLMNIILPGLDPPIDGNHTMHSV